MYALLALGADRTGIVAGITAVLVRHGVNIADSQMSILQGQFAMVLILVAPANLDLEALRRELAEAGRSLRLDAVVVNEMEDALPEGSEPTHAITVYGGDHPGIVHSVTSALAAAGVNVTGLTTRLGGGDEPIYLMVVEVAAREDVDLHRTLGAVADEQSVEVRIQALEPATL